MPDYQLGKIYLITSETNKLLYVGSTCQKYISTRITGHIKDYKYGGKYCCSHKVLECDDYNYKLLKEFPCSNVQQLRREEGFWILHYKNQTDYECVNQVVAGRTWKEWRDDNIDKIAEKKKEYYNNNKDKIKEQVKEYQENNRDKVLEQKKEHYKNNKDKILEQRKEHYKNNRDKILEQKKEYDKKRRENNKIKDKK